MAFPVHRGRRLRRTEAVRAMVRETELNSRDFILPFFVVHGRKVRREISSMPGNYQLSIDEFLKEAVETYQLGIPAVILFGIPDQKDPLGSAGHSEKGIVQQAIRQLKKELPELYVITDVCLCEYTDHGHCGKITDGEVDNDATVELLVKQALSHAQAGADMVAPSDMMDGRVGAIRTGLDENGFSQVPIMSYAAKYASAFYGPFREAAESAPAFGDRRGYQMDPPNLREAMREVALDIEEGADIIMVKPAMFYLDIVYRAKVEFGMPLAVYNVSGEFTMIKSAAQLERIDEKAILTEVLTGFKRAGADLIITYFAKDVARGL